MTSKYPYSFPQIPKIPTIEEIDAEREEAEEVARRERIASEVATSGQLARPDAISYVINRAKSI